MPQPLTSAGSPVHAIDGSTVLEAYAAAECQATERLVHQTTVENLYTAYPSGGGMDVLDRIFSVQAWGRGTISPLARSERAILSS